jgi:hypothetical protein
MSFQKMWNYWALVLAFFYNLFTPYMEWPDTVKVGNATTIPDMYRQIMIAHPGMFLIDYKGYTDCLTPRFDHPTEGERQRMFNESGMIVLRVPLRKITLLVGGSRKDEYIGVMTVNPIVYENPSVLGIFGVQKMPQVFERKFEQVVFDNFFPFESKMALKCLEEAERTVKPGGLIKYRGAIDGDRVLDLDRIRFVASRLPSVNSVGLYYL